MNRLELKDINQQVRREAWATRPAIDVGRAKYMPAVGVPTVSDLLFFNFK